MLSEEELDIILSGCYITCYTLQYWNDNADKWIALSPSAQTRGKDFSWKQLGRADLKGGLSAAGGGVASYLLGCGPVGIKAWAAVILAGAAVGSIDNAIDQLWPEEE